MMEQILNYGAFFGGLAFLFWCIGHLLYEAIGDLVRDRRKKRGGGL